MRTKYVAINLALALLTLLAMVAMPRRGAAADDPKQPTTTTTTKTVKTDTTTAAAPEMTMKEAKQKLGIIVFPAKGQTPDQQDADERECLIWGADQLGINPNAPPVDAKAAGQQAKAKTDSATAGVAVKGAAKGAAIGAVFGSISGNAGAGAAYGATAGVLGGRKARKQAGKQADAAAQQKVAAERQAKIDALKKAMTACLEPKGYTVK
jgi:hypothetical protein